MDHIVRVPCDKCHKQFASKDSLRRHRREVHEQRRLVKYQCDMCHQQFRHIQNLRRHRHEVHKRDDETEVWELQLRKKLDGRQSMASGFWTQAAIARARPERTEAFSREADDGGCSAARLSSGIGGLQQPTMLPEHQLAKPAKADIHLLVGSVDESDDMHLARHAGPAGQNCLRCVVIRNKERLARIAPWASQRPSH